MALAGALFALMLGVVFSGLLSRATRLPVPLVQIALGAAIHHANLASLELDPEVFFLVLLPPLLFLDGWRIPKDDLLRDAPTILTLALGLVVFTVLGVGWFIHALLPAVPLPVALALAAAISPTDPIAVSAIASRTPMPLRMRRILEGESLFNDASGLVCMRLAVAAALTGTFSLGDALLDFAWLALGGLGIGVALTRLVNTLTAGAAAPTPEGDAARILTTLLVPSSVYLLAESLGCSGILAAVASGITMGMTPQAHRHASTRIRRAAVWDTVQFTANGAVFVLLGEQIPGILAEAPRTVLLTGHANPWWLAVYVVLVLLALAGLRYLWVVVSVRLAFRHPGPDGTVLPASYRRLVLAMSVAGVRGAITLAGVLTLPLALPGGAPFPARNLAIALAAGVIVLSLVLATVALPQALRGLKLPAEPPRHDQEQQARSAAAAAALRAVLAASGQGPDDAQDRLVHARAASRVAAGYRERLARFEDDDPALRVPGAINAIERRLHLVGLRAEREELLASGRAHGVKDIVLRRLLREVDLQEARFSA